MQLAENSINRLDNKSNFNFEDFTSSFSRSVIYFIKSNKIKNQQKVIV